jgi:hypothetical protein
LEFVFELKRWGQLRASRTEAITLKRPQAPFTSVPLERLDIEEYGSALVLVVSSKNDVGAKDSNEVPKIKDADANLLQ